MSTIQYAIELYADCDGGVTTDTDWGLVDSVYRWITGRPGYDGATPYPTWEDTTNNTDVWYQGFLLRDAMSNPSRQVNIDVTGEYGTLSGFNFAIANANKFWKHLEDNDIFIINRTIKLYVVLDDVFYEAWTGVVSETPYNETNFSFRCIDKFRTVHKPLPPEVVAPPAFSEAKDSEQSTVVPITFGDVAYAKMVDVDTTVTWLTLWGDNDITPASFLDDVGSVGFNTEPAVVLHIPTGDYVTDALVGKYLFYMTSPSGDVSSRGIKIVGNGPTLMSGVNRVMYVMLAEQLPITPANYNGVNNQHTISGVDRDSANTDTYYYKIADINTRGVISYNDVSSVELDASGAPLVYYWSDDDKTFHSAQSSIVDYSVTGDTGLNYPYVEFAGNSISQKGGFKQLFPLVPDSVRVSEYDNGLTGVGSINQRANMIDRDRTTQYPLYVSGVKRNVEVEFEISLKNVIDADTEELYFGYDVGITGPSGRYMKTYTTMSLKDLFGIVMDITIPGSDEWPITVMYNTLTYPNMNLLPNDYYRGGGNDNDETSYYAGISQSIAPITDDVVSIIKNKIAAGKILITVNFDTTDNSIAGGYWAAGDMLLIKQMGFLGVKEVSIQNGDLYVKLKGELDNTDNETNNVYRIFKHILEDYDGISSSDIDYTNLPTTRNTWVAGRQITERKNSFEYLKELASHSFVCIVPTREGKRKLVAWREYTDDPVTHNSTTIVRDSITSYDKTKISDLYNNFYVVYSLNPASKQYERTMFIDSVDQDAFPAYGEDWSQYFAGLSEGSYATAKSLWDVCHRSYLRAAMISPPLPPRLAKLDWYHDPKIFDEDATEGVGVDSSTFKFLENCVEWTTRQKENVTYAIPMSSTNLTVDLLDPVIFNDDIYTNSTDRTGWITSVSVDTRNDQILIGTTLNPYDIEDISDGLIIERGIVLNEDTITESGSETDTVSETGV